MKTRKPRVLICDDEKLYHQTIQMALGDRFETFSVCHTDEALEFLKSHRVDLMLLDIAMRTPDEGLRAIPLIRQEDPDITIVISSGFSDFQSVRQAMRQGANDYVQKGTSAEDLQFAIERALEQRQNRQKQSQQNHELGVYQDKHFLVGESAPIQALRKVLNKIRISKANVLITGEPGSGKEIVARSLRGVLEDGSWAPFVSVDSATIQSSTAESMLFGYERGAFTGAEKATKGLFEEADGGVLYFDELGNMPLDIQAKLLRAIQEKEISRMGSVKKIELDLRVISATNQDLEQMVKQGTFRFDLLSRLNVIPVAIPPLRERVEDIPLLAHYFLKVHSNGKRVPEIGEEAMASLMAYRWPGNIRELSNVMIYLMTMVDSETVQREDLPPRLWSDESLGSESHSGSEGNFYHRVKAFESELLKKEYVKAQGNVAQMARDLGMDRSHLHLKLKSYAIHKGKA